MARMTFIIDGHDIAPLIAKDGIKWTRNDIDSANAGRTLDGTMNRGRVCQKMKLEIKCRPLSQSELHDLLNWINPEYVNVSYYDPLHGARTNIQFYSNNVPATVSVQDTDDVVWWKDISFPLVER